MWPEIVLAPKAPKCIWRRGLARTRREDQSTPPTIKIWNLLRQKVDKGNKRGKEREGREYNKGKIVGKWMDEKSGKY